MHPSHSVRFHPFRSLPAMPILVGIGLAGWALLVTILALAGVYATPVDRLPVATLASLLTPLAGFALAMQFPSIRARVLALEEAPLILLHTWRMLGLGFVFLYVHGQLPALFALPAGLGDALAAIGATMICLRLFRDRPVSVKQRIVWNLFGLLDFVVAVAAGVLTRTRWNGGVPSWAMGEFPLALIPGFAVPLFAITHLILLTKLFGLRREG